MPSKYVIQHTAVPEKGSSYDNPAFPHTADLSDPYKGDTPDYEVISGYSDKPSTNGTAPNKHGDGSSDSSKGKTKKEKPNVVGIGETFRFATGKDKLLMLMGTISAAIQGAAMPMMMVLFGTMTDTFIDSGTISNNLDIWVPIWQETCRNMTLGAPPPSPCDNITEDYFLNDPSPPKRYVSLCFQLNFPVGCENVNSTDTLEMKTLMEQMGEYAIYYVIIGCCVLFIGYLHVLGWQTAAYNQSQRVRSRLFHSILRMEIGWFDTHEVGELNTRLSDDVAKYESGIGDKLGLFINFTSTFVAGYIIGFVYSWKLALVILSISPLLATAGAIMARMGAVMTSKELQSYAKAGAVAEEVFGAIRTVMAFGGEEKESERYNGNLYAAKKFGIKKGYINGIAMGTIFFIIYSSYGLAFWYGSQLVFDGDISPGTIMIVFFSMMTGTFSLGNAAPNIQDFANARGAAYALFGIIDREPLIDSSSTKGRKEEKITGNVTFRNIHFNYPSRPQVKVLQGLNMDVQVGKTVALVGPSGCGKSTTVQLLQRFYDPEVGQILLDGTDIREFNIKWLRQQIGVVSQEPVLFATTIAENIRYGYDDVTDEDITRACREANAHDFISKLPKKYETLVGERGAQLSGGQKQRIAIARALVRNPKILLLDEATSALDTESESTVQAALDKARLGRTTLVIAHRLSTIRTADVIVGLQDGVVTEQGTHDELMAKQGLYHELVMNQQLFFEAEDGTKDITEKPDFLRGISVRSSGKMRTMSELSNGVPKGMHHQISRMSTKVEEEELSTPPLKKIMQLNKPEMSLIVIGCISAVVTGVVQPFMALVLTEILGLYSETGDDVQDQVNMYSGLFVAIGVAAGLSTAISGIMFAKSGEYLTMRLRQLSFSKVLTLDMSFYDDPRNSVGALCTRLATDASAVQGATGVALATFARSVSSIGAGIVIGFIFSWQMTLLIIGFAPFMLASGYVQGRARVGGLAKKNDGLEEAGKTAIEAIENIRTVATLTKEDLFYEKYVALTLKPNKDNKKGAHIQGISYSFSQAVMFYAFAAAFSLGAFLVQNKGLEYKNMFRVFTAIVFSAISAGQATSFAPDYGKAKMAAAKIFALLDTKPAIDSSDKSGTQLSDCDGSVRLNDVYFNYPSRPGVPVLQGLDLMVNPGQTVALVGSSGCGKSTTVALLERFYDTRDGQVAVEGHNIVDLNLQSLRSQIGLVSQEPILFDASIRDNIAYGDNSRQVSMPEIIEAARNANIHSFIESIPEGYDTNVGDKGTQLSGGQKQRIAIARALVRNPKILLLDEATSALDTESEKIVQAALDRAQEGRTCIVIAHRLSTIRNADCIVVIHQGHAVELGTHAELMKLKGRYYRLNNIKGANR